MLSIARRHVPSSKHPATTSRTGTPLRAHRSPLGLSIPLLFPLTLALSAVADVDVQVQIQGPANTRVPIGTELTYTVNVTGVAGPTTVSIPAPVGSLPVPIVTTTTGTCLVDPSCKAITCSVSANADITVRFTPTVQAPIKVAVGVVSDELDSNLTNNSDTLEMLAYLRGDANSDALVNVTDVLYLINHLFAGGPPSQYLEGGDANHDGVVTVADVLYLINYLFAGGPPPPAAPAPPGSQGDSVGDSDVLTIATLNTTTTSGTVRVPLYIRDNLGTPIGQDRPASQRISAIAFQIEYGPSCVTDIYLDATTGILQGVPTRFEGGGEIPGRSVGYVRTYSGTIPFTVPGGQGPGDKIGDLVVTTSNCPIGTIPLHLTGTGGAAALLSCPSCPPTVDETLENGGLTLVDGALVLSAPTPTIASVSPAVGPTLGGTTVTVTGTNFTQGATVLVGGAAANVTSTSSTQIVATTGAHAYGAADVVVTNPGGPTATRTNGFVYDDPPVAVLSPSSTSGFSPWLVTLYGQGSSDPNTAAGDSIASYTFTFGDGSSPVTQTQTYATHTYSTPGTYTATLVVTDTRGVSSSPVSASPITIQQGTNNAVWVSDNVPTTMNRGVSYNVMITFRNTGNNYWPAMSDYKLQSLNPPNNTTWGPSPTGVLYPAAPPEHYRHLLHHRYRARDPWHLQPAIRNVAGPWIRFADAQQGHRREELAMGMTHMRVPSVSVATRSRGVTTSQADPRSTSGSGIRIFVMCCLLFSAIPAAAQTWAEDDDPTQYPGYVQNVFQSSSFDDVNLYSGQLVVPLPIGPSYPIGPKLRLQLMLVYNSRVWEYGRTAAGAPPRPLKGDPALGIGWSLHLGKIVLHGVPRYIAPDGAEHKFGESFTEGGVAYRRSYDGSQFVLREQGTSGYEMWDGDGNHYVFGAGGYVHGYDQGAHDPPDGNYEEDFGRSRDGWYLTSLSDPFGNSYTVSYQTKSMASPCYYTSSGCANNIGQMWCQSADPASHSWVPAEITLPSGRPITFGVTDAPVGMISSITFPVAPPAGGNDTATATWSLGYDQLSWLRPGDPYCATATVLLKRLVSVTLPTADSYLFGYQSGVSEEGYLTDVTLPTGGHIGYKYGYYQHYHGRLNSLPTSCNIAVPPANLPAAATVEQRIPRPTYSPSGPEQPSGTESACSEPNFDGRWLQQQIGIIERVEGPAVTTYYQISFPYGESGGAKAESLTLAALPNGTFRSTLFYDSPLSDSTSTEIGDRTGAAIRDAFYSSSPWPTWGPQLPSTGCSTSGGEPFCAANAFKLVAYEYDYQNPTAQLYNRRLKKTTTTWGTHANDGSCEECVTHTVTYSNTSTDPGAWEANGRHYNIEAHEGTVGSGGDARTVTTVWAPQGHLKNLFSSQTVSGASSAPTSVTTNYCFDDDGFLKRSYLLSGGNKVVRGHGRTASTENGEKGYPTSETYAKEVSDCAATSSPTHTRNLSRTSTLSTAQWSGVPSKFFELYETLHPTTGLRTASRDSGGFSTGYEFADSLQRLTKITPPSGEATTTITYSNPNFTSVAVSGADDSAARAYSYDTFGRLSREVRQLPDEGGTARYAVRQRTYDAAGRTSFVSTWKNCTSPVETGDCFVSTAFDATREGMRYEYSDPLGRVSKITAPDDADTRNGTESNGFVTFSYLDASGRLVEHITSAVTNDVSGSPSTTTTTRDAFGRITRVEQTGGTPVDYSYNALDKLATVIQGTQTRTMTYNAFGFLTAEVDPEKSVTYSNHDVLGRPGTVTSGGIALTYAYDKAGRIETITAGTTPYVTNTYDGGLTNCDAPTAPCGKLTQRVGQNPAATPASTVTETFAYGGTGGRLSSKTTTISGGALPPLSESWKYSALGLVRRHSHPRSTGQFVVDTTYSHGTATGMYFGGLPAITDMKYSAAGALREYKLGYRATDSVKTVIAQDASGLPRPSAITATSAGTELFSTGSYVYDTAGNITDIGEDVLGYDRLSRLTSAVYGDLGQAEYYTYGDSFNNLTKRERRTYPGGVLQHETVFTFPTAASNNNQLLSYTDREVPGQGSPVSVSYDPRGNLTTIGGLTYTWDSLGRLVQQGTGTPFFAYDGAGERVMKAPSGGSSSSYTYTLRDTTGRISSVFEGASVTNDYVFLGQSLVASTDGCACNFYVADHLGTPRLRVDGFGGRQEPNRKYWPFGQDTTLLDTPQRHAFAAMERDIEIDAPRYYDHARSVDGVLGRFLSPDKLGGRISDPQSWNRYTYARNNPLKYVDPTGLVIEYAPSFTARVKSDPVFKAGFEAWRATPSGGKQWQRMGGDTNTTYQFNVGEVVARTAAGNEQRANGRTLPVVTQGNENKQGRLDVPSVTITIDADRVEDNNTPPPTGSTTEGEMAKALFEEAAHGLDIGSGTRSWLGAVTMERLFDTGMEPRMTLFKEELEKLLPVPLN